MTESAQKRFKAVKQIMAHEYNAIIVVSLLTMFSFLLFLVWFGFKYFTDASVYSGLLEDKSNIDTVRQDLFNNQILFSFISFGAIPLSFILFGGVIGYLCELNFSMNKPRFKVYLSAIKRNLKYSLFVGFVVTFIYNLCAILKWGNNPYFSLVYIGIIILSILFIYPSLLLVMFEGYIYQGKLGRAIKNAYILFFSETFFNCLFFYLSAVPLILFFVFKDEFIVYFLLLILGVYGFGMIFAALSGRIFYIFDKYVNKHNYPELFEKNLDIINKEK